MLKVNPAALARAGIRLYIPVLAELITISKSTCVSYSLDIKWDENVSLSAEPQHVAQWGSAVHFLECLSKPEEFRSTRVITELHYLENETKFRPQLLVNYEKRKIAI